MKNKIVYLFFIISISLFVGTNTKALTYGGCEYSQISRLKSFVSNINFSYDYYIDNDNVYFNITLTNLVPGIYFIDSTTNKKYSYYDSVNGEITITGYNVSNGNYKFYTELNECYGVKLGNRYYKFPKYNRHYNDPLCKENTNYSLCQKWVSVTYSRDEFEAMINKYKNTEQENNEKDDTEIIYKQTYLDKVVEFYVDYYYILLGGIIIICITIMIISSRRNRFDI